jgi:hypothetical protein
MKTLLISDEQVWETWNLCSDAYVRHGRKLAFPKNTPPTKTYQWRYAKSLATKFEEWAFDNDTAMKFIDVAVKHAKRNHTLHKGLAALLQGNLPQICYAAVTREEENSQQSLKSLELMKEWLDRQIGVRPPVTTLLSRSTPHAFCNIAMWYQSSRLSPLFLALSRNCGRALAKLSGQDQTERSTMPSVTDLYRMRSDFVADRHVAKQAQAIFGTDWRALCLSH